jgi:hypothetical protein
LRQPEAPIAGNRTTANGLTLLTRNDRDVAGVGTMLLNPFPGGESEHRT